MYLPQYHITPENSEFWGEGYTDWEAVKKVSHYLVNIINRVYRLVITIMI